ncbi:MAG: hypothetical protein ACOCWR_09405, partial [Oceanidesulfovibrio sp.]
MGRLIFTLALLCLVLAVQTAGAAEPADGMISPSQIQAMATSGDSNSTSETPTDEPEHDTIFPMEEQNGGQLLAPTVLAPARRPVSVDGSP